MRYTCVCALPIPFPRYIIHGVHVVEGEGPNLMGRLDEEPQIDPERG